MNYTIKNLVTGLTLKNLTMDDVAKHTEWEEEIVAYGCVQAESTRGPVMLTEWMIMMDEVKTNPPVTIYELWDQMYETVLGYARFSDLSRVVFNDIMTSRNMVMIFEIYKKMDFNALYAPVLIDHSDGIETTKILNHVELTIEGADGNMFSQYELHSFKTYPIGFFLHLDDARACLGKFPDVIEDLQYIENAYHWEEGVGGAKSRKGPALTKGFLVECKLRGESIAFKEKRNVALLLGMKLSSITDGLDLVLANSETLKLGAYTITATDIGE